MKLAIFIVLLYLSVKGARGYMAVVSNTTEGNGTALYLLDVTSSTPLLSTSLSGHYLSHHCSYGSQCVTIVAVDEYGQQILVVSLEDGIWIVMINNYQSARQLYLDSMHTIDTSCATLHIGNSVKQESLLVLCTIGFRLLAYNVQLDALIIRNSLFSAPTELTTLPSHNRSRPVSSIIESQDGTLHFIVEDVHYRVDNLTILMKKVFQNTTARSVQFVVSSRPSEETTTMCTSQLPTTRDITAANSSKTDGVPLIITIIIAALFVFVGPIVCMILFINYSKNQRQGKKKPKSAKEDSRVSSTAASEEEHNFNTCTENSVLEAPDCTPPEVGTVPNIPSLTLSLPKYSKGCTETAL